VSGNHIVLASFAIWFMSLCRMRALQIN